MNILYTQITDRCQARIKAGEAYTVPMWFEEAHKLLITYQGEGLTGTCEELQSIINRNKAMCIIIGLGVTT